MEYNMDETGDDGYWARYSQATKLATRLPAESCVYLNIWVLFV
jgi:hypothetical protein